LIRPDERLVIPVLVLAVAAVRWPSPNKYTDTALVALYLGILLSNTAIFVRGGAAVDRLVRDLSPYVMRQHHPHFLSVPCRSSYTAVEQWLPFVDRASRSGFYWTINRGGSNRQILDTRIIRVRNSAPDTGSMFISPYVKDLEVHLADLKNTVLRDYSTIAIVGCVASSGKTAKLLSDSFAPVADSLLKSPHLMILQRRAS
jgi:hypothetical protein